MKGFLLAVCGMMLGVLCGAGSALGAGTMMDGANSPTDATPPEPLVSSLDPEAEAQLQSLLEQLQQPNARLPKQRIRMMGKDAVPSLVEALDETETVQAQQILELLGNIGDERVMPKLAELMHSENSWIRCAAVYAIGRIGGKNAIPLLMSALHDKNFRVCEISIETLASFNDLRAVPLLIELIQSPQPELAEKSAKALAMLTNGSPDYGSDWMSWQLWYETDSRFDAYRQQESSRPAQ